MSRSVLRGSIASLSVGALVAGSLALFGAPVSAESTSGLKTFTTPGDYEWTVPDGVTSVRLTVIGAGGGTGGPATYGEAGQGAALVAHMAVTPGETLGVHVGGMGGTGGTTAGNEGGFNGGGASLGGDTCGSSTFAGASGGGASDVRRGGDDLSDRVVVAGGGGGGGGGRPGTHAGAGGDGGADTADAVDGGESNVDGDTIAGGFAPVEDQGGVGGSGGTMAGEVAGEDGAFGLGGAAASDGCVGGGGGGGGFYGGGGGAAVPDEAGGAGAGGTSYVAPGLTVSESYAGYRTYDGSVYIAWAGPTTTTTTSTTTTTAPAAPAPAPAAAAPCPVPVPPLRVTANEFSAAVARFLITECGASARWTVAGRQGLLVLDPPNGGACPTWRAVRVVPSRGSLLIAKHLLDNCRFEVRLQMEGTTGAAYVVPSGYPAGRVTP